MGGQLPAATVDDDAAHASARVLDAAITLAKAEGQLVLSGLRLGLERALVAAGLLWAAASAAHLAIALICVSPLLLPVYGPALVIVSVGLSLGMGVGLGALGVRRVQTFTRPEKPTKSGSHESPVPRHELET